VVTIMTTLGKNVRITIDRELRGKLRAVLEGVLGCEVMSPMPNIDVYRYAGGSLGAYLVSTAEALPAAELRKAPWLELCVADPAAVKKGLAALGMTPFEYHDKQHDYYELPGGVVFRLAQA
jgi:hypothetical protein